jgi:hypothetical protein
MSEATAIPMQVSRTPNSALPIEVGSASWAAPHAPRIKVDDGGRQGFRLAEPRTVENCVEDLELFGR